MVVGNFMTRGNVSMIKEGVVCWHSPVCPHTPTLTSLKQHSPQLLLFPIYITDYACDNSPQLKLGASQFDRTSQRRPSLMAVPRP